MACECSARHFHINDDWVILEAVDENNKPVPHGTQSSKVLLTNLANRICPIIRFEITDRIVIHDEPCECGNKQETFRAAKKAVESYLSQNGVLADVYLSEKLPEANPVSGKYKHIIKIH